MAEKCALKLALDLKETAAALGLSTITVRRLKKRGLLNHVRGIRHLRFSVKEVERFLTDASRQIELGKIGHGVSRATFTARETKAKEVSN